MPIAAPRKQLRRELIDACSARPMQCPGQKVQRILAGERSEPLLDVARIHTRPAQQFVDHLTWPFALDDRERHQGAIFRAQLRALLEKQIVIGGLGFSRHGEGVDRQTTIRQTIAGRIPCGPTKFLTQIREEPPVFRFRHGESLLLRQRQVRVRRRRCPRTSARVLSANSSAHRRLSAS